MAFFKKGQVADFFLNEENPYSKKRTIKTKHVGITFGILILVVFIAGSVLEKKDEAEKAQAKTALELKDAQRSLTNQAAQAGEPDRYVSLSGKGAVNSYAVGNRVSSQRQISASQIIERGKSSSDVLPMGSKIRAEVRGTATSTDNNSPITAVVLEDAQSPVGALVIPRGTMAIGSGQLDVSRERLQVQFHTLVFPDGQQFSLSALAMMPDGSSGIEGSFSSGQLKKNVGQFLGNFVGGLAQGMKDRTSQGQLGIPMETGGIKNGVLNGVAQSSMNYAKTTSQEIGQGGASITVRSGTIFQVYLEREFHQ